MRRLDPRGPTRAAGGGGGGGGGGAGVDAPVAPPSGSCATPFSGALATWTLTGAPGSQASTPAGSTAPGVTATDLSRAPGLSTASGADSINASNWPTGSSPDPSKYYTLTVTPAAGCALDLSSLSVSLKTSSTGPGQAAAATSADSFAQLAQLAMSGPSAPSLSVSDQTGAIEVRISGFAASGAAGTMRLLDTVTLTGSLH